MGLRFQRLIYVIHTHDFPFLIGNQTFAYL